MATPFFRIQSFNTTIFAANTGSFRVNTFDSTGAVVDVSSGYTIEAMQLRASSGANPNFSYGSGLDVLAQFDIAFDETGFTVSWDAAAASALNAAPAQLTSQLSISISNDAGTTEQLVAVGSVTVSQLGITP